MPDSRTEADRQQDAGAIEALIEAEREWRTRLDAARSDAARQVADAREAAEIRISAVKSELGPEVDRRRRALEEDLSEELARIERDARQEAARFSEIDDAFVRRLAREIARRCVWAAPEPER